MAALPEQQYTAQHHLTVSTRTPEVLWVFVTVTQSHFTSTKQAMKNLTKHGYGAARILRYPTVSHL